MHVLDHPIWNALCTRHAGIAVGDALAKRYPSDLLPFADISGNEKENWDALLKLLERGDQCILIQKDPITVKVSVPATFASGLQMVAAESVQGGFHPDIVKLGSEYVPQIMELCSLTHAAPVRAGTSSIQQFWGILSEGRLIAMAGERFKQPGFSEISAVCTHPEHRGQGLARALTMHLVQQIRSQEETPYLHVYATNKAAISLYESLGFKVRMPVYSAIVG
ncbi:GNAT family N-acetyltransferase [Phyllobacterium myrsinacearum]|uniref:GNAT family N-acetyltransferase n=1 Tax=Phyllobacterium myrsinacearum TaxID=28101 RepID=A0A2S9JP73_9HYPH|nr:GNAT family N-acetyltransferase [Phyllobacterium myrsinacearum]PRD55030.1 GNAT family N-acetyltransferase [Phyllobacterium myrsinacearum]PWV90417.1 FR47-like protein [Phyllobacterium myrsinacearum]RZS79815.1 FR47-like protein [Phyllobacterium myrsinacearum]RZV05389.1 FR47-like protein [Phyllobacterium myrsinacearum]